MNERAARVTGRVAGVLAVLFGLATIASGGQALFGGEAAREAVGAAVPFVLWFNFLAGFAYVVAGAGLYLRKAWALPLSVAIALATLAVFAGLGFHVMQGGDYEARTVGAMVIRLAAWIAFSAVAWWTVRRRPQPGPAV